MAARYSTLCELCDEDAMVNTYCSTCQKTLCPRCFSYHTEDCQQAAPGPHAASSDYTSHRTWGTHSPLTFTSPSRQRQYMSSPRLSGQGGDSQDDVRTRLDELSAYIDDMAVKYNAVEIKASALQEENSSLRQDLRSAHDNNAKLLLDFREMQREHSTLQRDVRSMQREMDELRDKNFTLCEDMATLKTEMGKTTQQVAFHARLSGNVYGQNNPQLVIVCSDVLTNIGGGYDPQTGIFTAPVAGTYLFAAMASSNSAGQVFYIDLDGTNIAAPYSNATNGSTTCQVILQLSVGQKVTMKAISHYLFQGNVAAQQTWTSFSGMLVQSDM